MTGSGEEQGSRGGSSGDFPEYGGGVSGEFSVVTDVARKIRDMEIRGAGKIGLSASEALVAFSKKWLEARRGECGPGSENKERFVSDLGRAVEILASSRPTAVSLKNALLFTVSGVEEMGSAEEMAGFIESRHRWFRGVFDTARKKIAEYGSSLIPEDATVMTHCNSTAAVKTIIEGYKKGCVKRVFLTETRPRFQGRITARQLREAGVPATMVVDSGMRYFVRDADIVIVGADTVTSTGVLVNKIGTGLLALAAEESRVPFYSCAECFKFSPFTLGGGRVVIEERSPSEIWPDEKSGGKEGLSPPEGLEFRNPAFETVAPDLIDGYITDMGVLSPHTAPMVIFDRFFGKILEDNIWFERLKKIG